MTTERYIAQARQAAAELRAEGQPVLPLADVYQLTPATRRLLQALVGLCIVAPDEVPDLGHASLPRSRS